MRELFEAGGPVMWPLLLLSMLALAAIGERGLFWAGLLWRERQTATQIVLAARQDFAQAAQIAKLASDTPIGRFLYAPLALNEPEPDIFRLALESAADDELAGMLRGETLLESVIALAPLLGLLGTVLGLIVSFSSLRIGDVASNAASGELTRGIGEALVSTATGLTVAIATLAFHRLFLGLHAQQVTIFRKLGNDLELLYRLHWQERQQSTKND